MYLALISFTTSGSKEASRFAVNEVEYPLLSFQEHSSSVSGLVT
jgi:hypothetical protein